MALFGAFRLLFFLICWSEIMSQTKLSDDERIMLLDPSDETKVDFLPASVVNGWSTWVLSEDKDRIANFVKIPDDSDGYINAISQSELWQSVDLKYPNSRLALGLHVRNGQLRHLFPALDVFFGHESGVHRNRGLNTVPRANTWLSIHDITALSSFYLEMSSRDLKRGEQQWTLISSSRPIKEALEFAIYSLAESPPNELGSGSHIIHVLLSDQQIVLCPKVGNEILATLQAPRKQDGDHSIGTLNVKVSATQAGSKSNFLPKEYKKLYDNQDYQRAEYFEFRQRQENRKEKEREEAMRRRKERDGDL